MDRYVCVHGHFYQPPRENPWLEVVELQDSAYPYHDWNERITSESYGPNARSRILDGENRIVRIANNYSRMSFNFGPTLLKWLEDEALGVYESILEADRESAGHFSGHGSALAQCWGHMIMPLANSRDKYTQVLWGIRDFEHRFGRRPGECGCRKPPWTWRRWTSWRSWASGSQYWSRTRRPASADWAPGRGRT